MADKKESNSSGFISSMFSFAENHSSLLLISTISLVIIIFIMLLYYRGWIGNFKKENLKKSNSSEDSSSQEIEKLIGDIETSQSENINKK